MREGAPGKAVGGKRGGAGAEGDGQGEDLYQGSPRGRGDGEEVTVMARGGETECLPDCQTDGKEIARARGRMGMEGPGRDGDRQRAGDESEIGRVIT